MKALFFAMLLVSVSVYAGATPIVFNDFCDDCSTVNAEVGEGYQLRSQMRGEQFIAAGYLGFSGYAKRFAPSLNHRFRDRYTQLAHVEFNADISGFVDRFAAGRADHRPGQGFASFVRSDNRMAETTKTLITCLDAQCVRTPLDNTAEPMVADNAKIAIPAYSSMIVMLLFACCFYAFVLAPSSGDA